MKKGFTYLLFSCVLLAQFMLTLTLHLPNIAEAKVYSANLAVTSVMINEPSVKLENGNNSVSIVYLNNTSAKITITATNQSQTYYYALNINNIASQSWKVHLEYVDYTNLSCVDASVVLHNGTYELWQIKIEKGTISVNSTVYDLPSNTTIYLGVQDVLGRSQGTMVLYANLKISYPNKTTTYMLYTIKFELSYNP